MVKILLIDDDEAIRLVFKTTLEKAGFTVTDASTGKEGIEKAKTDQPNLILLDQIMPDIAGNDVLKQLKSDQSTTSIKVVLLSNFGQNELIKEALERGALDYLLKYQIEPQDLVNKVQGFLAEAKTENKT